MSFVCFQQIATVATVIIDNRGRLVSVTGTVTRIRGACLAGGSLFGDPHHASRSIRRMDSQNKWLIVLLAWLDELESTGVGTGCAYGSISGDGAS